MAYETELQVAREAVRRAARLTSRVARTRVEAVVKSDSSPVTVADFGAQAVVIAALPAGDNVVGEEDAGRLRADPALAEEVWRLAAEADPENEQLRTRDGVLAAIDRGSYAGGAKGRQWALDPVDGTKGFLRGGQYAVCLALIVDSRVELGVVGCPNLGPGGGLFWAVRGQGAFWEPLDAAAAGAGAPTAPQRLAFRDLASPADATFCESVEAGHSALDVQAAIASRLGITRPPVQMDSQAKYCALARGDADIYLRLPVNMSYEEKIWDHAAGNLLITEAGGVVTDMRGRPLDFGAGRTLRHNKGVIASSPVVHKQIIDVVGEFYPAA